MIDAQTLWFASRATGAVALVLFTAVMVLGMLTAGRGAPVRLPAVVKVGLHRNLSLLLTVFVAVHAVTAIVDGFVDISWWALVVPFASAYETLGITLGTLAIDLILALIVTGVLRHRLSHRAWQAVHLVSYAMYPLTILHAVLLAGVDAVWVIALSVVCGAAYVAAVVWRARIEWRDRATRERLADRFRAPLHANGPQRPSPLAPQSNGQRSPRPVARPRVVSAAGNPARTL
ncbi:ferric reductase-like transmembrane domain-containing protein [Micrococcales bacterium 31B]|nr:ferric reductase-like transmembrane domain-containing protein [Micrococcales bacterium 31B]